MAGRTYEVDKKPAKQKEKIRQDIIEHTGSLRAIACQNDINRESLRRYKNNVLTEELAQADKERFQATLDTFVEMLTSKAGILETMVVSVEEELRQGRADGKYDLSDIGRALALSKMLNDAIKTLKEVIVDILKIQGNIKETAEINTRPELFITFFCQILRETNISSEAMDEIFDRLNKIQADIDNRKP